MTHDNGAYYVKLGVGASVCYIGRDSMPRPALVQGPGWTDGNLTLLVFPATGETMFSSDVQPHPLPYRAELNVPHLADNQGQTTHCWLLTEEANAR